MIQHFIQSKLFIKVESIKSIKFIEKVNSKVDSITVDSIELIKFILKVDKKSWFNQSYSSKLLKSF